MRLFDVLAVDDVALLASFLEFFGFVLLCWRLIFDGVLAFRREEAFLRLGFLPLGLFYGL